MPKTDGSVRLCGDYKITVNRCIYTDQHPIPTPDEVLAKIAGGQKFTKIDLKCAYQQMQLDDKSQELVTINTSRGLYRYTRLPFGTSSSPAIWQRFIDQVLQGLDGVCAIQDDVLVTGVNDGDHLRNLENVLQRFEKFGLRVKPEICPMKSTNAEATINELRNIFARNGLPQQLVSDNGPPFRSAEFETFMKMNGVKHILCHLIIRLAMDWRRDLLEASNRP